MREHQICHDPHTHTHSNDDECVSSLRRHVNSRSNDGIFCGSSMNPFFPGPQWNYSIRRRMRYTCSISVATPTMWLGCLCEMKGRQINCVQIVMVIDLRNAISLHVILFALDDIRIFAPMTTHTHTRALCCNELLLLPPFFVVVEWKQKKNTLRMFSCLNVSICVGVSVCCTIMCERKRCQRNINNRTSSTWATVIR